MDAPPPPKSQPPSLLRRLRPGLAVLLVLALIGWWQRPDGYLHLTTLAVRGDAFVLQLPDGGVVLIDGGSDPAALAVGLGRQMPFWQRSLRAVLLTNSDHRRLPGQVAALARYQVGQAFMPPNLASYGAAGEWRRLLAQRSVPIAALRAGQRLRFGAVVIDVLAWNDDDEGGAVLLLGYGRTRILIHSGGSAGDAAAAQVVGPDLLIYPWQRPTDNALLAAIRPQAIVFSAAYEAPEPALLTMYERHRAARRLYHPALAGPVTLSSDGQRAWIIATHQ